MDERDNVSYQAFLQELQNWQLTLNRQAKKLKSSISQQTNKFKINQIQIILTEIQSQIIKYRKIKDKKKIDSLTIIQQYNILSKRFMDLMQKIGGCCDQPEIAQSIQQQQQIQSNLNEVSRLHNKNRRKRFMEETFTHKVSKQSTKNLSRSKKPSINKVNDKLMEKIGFRKPSINVKKQSENISMNVSRHLKSNISFHKKTEEEQNDLWDIRYQLKEIKSMMTQIQNQIKFHVHDALELQMSKIQHNNKKMLLQLKSLKDDNKFTLAKIQTLKQQIQGQKKAQALMVKQFQKPRNEQREKAFYDRQQGLTQDVSDWVKMRI